MRRCVIGAILAALLVGGLALADHLPVGIGAVIAFAAGLGLLSSALDLLWLVTARSDAAWVRAVRHAWSDCAD